MGFERFDKATAIAVIKDPEVTVLPDGVVSMTWRAYEMIGTPRAVEFFFDRDRRVIGLGPADDDSNGYTVRQPRDNARGRVSVRGATVFKFYNIDITQKFKVTPTLEQGLLCFPVADVDGRHDTSFPTPSVEDFLREEEPPD